MSSEVDAQRYTDWFVWARSNLGRELDATHAAAEAAYRAGAGGALEAEQVAAARSAGTEPDALDAETMALAEWAAWALSTGRIPAADGLTVARHALATVQSNHDLDATMSSVLPAARKSHGIRNALIAVGAVVGLIVIAAIVSALTNGPGGDGASPFGPAHPSVQANVVADQANVSGQGFPSNSTVYVFVDQTAYLVTTDGRGSFVTTVAMPLGGHSVSICLDAEEYQCPASTYVSRVQ